jgi:porphobilinogen synthase
LLHIFTGFLKENGQIDHQASSLQLAQIAVHYASAGAHIVAPSDMMDGRVQSIRNLLDESGYHHVGVLAYSAKFASSFYGPFRSAAKSSPAQGDRSAYQLPPFSRKLAQRAIVSSILK